MKNHNFSHDFFDKWSENMAYILGFWYADGCILLNKSRNRIYKRFVISNTDKQIIDVISDIIGITPCVLKPRETWHKYSYDISVNSDKFFDFCYSLVGTTDKTHSTHFPKIPDEYLSHFVRGYFDGDGTIFLKKYKSRHGGQIVNLCSSFSASKESWLALEELKQLLINKLNIGNRKVIIDKKRIKNSLKLTSNSSKLSFNQYDTMLLCEWMYKDATIFMKRKKKIWDNFDKDKLRNSQKYFSNKV